MNYLESLELVVWFHLYPRRISGTYGRILPFWGPMRWSQCPSSIVLLPMRHPVSLRVPTRATWGTWGLPVVRVSDESWLLESFLTSNKPPWDSSLTFTPLCPCWWSLLMWPRGSILICRGQLAHELGDFYIQRLCKSGSPMSHNPLQCLSQASG